MNQPLALLSALMFASLLTGCGDDDASADRATPPGIASPNAAATSADAASWTISVTGAESLEIDMEPRFGCTNDQVHVLTMSQSPRFDLYLPAAIEPGRYPLARFDANADPSFVAGHAVVSVTGNIVPGSGSGYGPFYFQPQGGEITIERMPGGPGEFLTASIQATLASNDSETIDLDAELNLKASGMMMMNCQL
jgi:hypothetical protein